MPRLVLDGKDYPIPTLDELSLGEGVIFETHSGLTLAEFQQRTADEMPLAVLKALGVIAILRARQDVSEVEAVKAIETIPLVKLREAFPQEGGPVPLESEPNEQSESETPDSPEPSGPSSSSDGDLSPDSETPDNSGDPASESSVSDHLISAT